MYREEEEFVAGYVVLDSDRQLLTWQKDIQEFGKGKGVIVTFNNQKWTLQELFEVANYFALAIANGDWYVKTK